MNYKKINDITGWTVFLIACYTFLSTIEPTGSFWDCGEFIATANKLEVGHPPGAPLFLMLARVFILFAGDNVAKIPIMVNALSALMSAFTILFLFWTITAMGRKIIIDNAEQTLDRVLAVMGAGLVGSLAYTFSDSFWFSAVEGEVYASSSFFTAVSAPPRGFNSTWPFASDFSPMPLGGVAMARSNATSSSRFCSRRK